MIVLDTDVLTLIQRKSGEAYRRLSNRLAAAEEQPVCVTIISFEEQMRGWLAWIAKAKDAEKQITGYTRLRMLLEDFQTRPVIDFDSRAAEENQRLIKSKVRIGSMDLKIAAICLVQDALLVTRNVGDFGKVPGLEVEDWTI